MQTKKKGKSEVSRERDRIVTQPAVEAGIIRILDEG